jgi:PKD repeat protein
MKNLIYITFILPVFFISCESTPRAFFHIDKDEPEVGEEIFFINDSDHGKHFEWDFGDGYTSTEESPSHIYTGTGSYEVALIVTSKNGLTDKSKMTIDILIPTLLEIEVLEYYKEYAVANASIYIYPTLTDWESETNRVSQGYTDADGIAVFSHLDPYVFYVDVWETNHDNYALKNEDIGFIRTPEIIPHKINRFIAYVDYVQHSKGEGRRDRKVILKGLVRKVADKK